MSRKHRRHTQIGDRTQGAFIGKPNRQDLINFMVRRSKRELIRMGIVPDPATRPPKYKFSWNYGEITGVVYANDRFSARALIKTELGVPKNKRLPIGVEITRGDNPND